MRQLTIAITLLLSASALQARDEPFKVVVEQKGESDLEVRLVDVNDQTVAAPAGTTFLLKANNGQLRPADKSQPWTDVIRNCTFDKGALYDFCSDNLWWPNDVTISAVVMVPNRLPIPARVLKVAVRPYLAVRLGLALLGAVLFSLLPITQAKSASAQSRLASIGAAVIAGIVAFFAADSATVWRIVGFKDEIPSQPQSYFVLGLVLAAMGVRPLMQKLLGEKSVSTLTAEEVKNEVVLLLSGDSVRAPFRDEVRKMLFDPDYVMQHSELIGPLELALAAAKSQSGLPSGLTSHLEPRLQRAYGGSYRSNLHTRISATIDRERDHISWVQHVSYRYVRNPADTSGEPEVTFGHIAEIPPAWREEHPTKLMSFGAVFLALRLSVRNAAGGAPLIYEAQRGKLIRREAPAGSTAPTEFDLSFAHDPEKNELAMAFAMNLPEELRTPDVLVDINLKYISQLEDGVSFVRVSRLTEGYHLFIEFSPRVRFDLAEFEWKVAGLDSTTVDKTAGEVHLPGWLLPGNGVAVAWNGTKEVAIVVNNQTQAQPHGMVRRMLGWLSWNRR